MLIGVVMEVKTAERRCALTPNGTRELTRLGHSVLVQTGAGDGSGFPDARYADAGAAIAGDAASVWTDAELLLEVKEPTDPEYSHLREGQILFTYLHLAANPELVSALISSFTTAVAYETIEDGTGGLGAVVGTQAARSRVEWALTSRSSTPLFGGCASSMSSSTAVSAHLCRRTARSQTRCREPTS